MTEVKLDKELENLLNQEKAIPELLENGGYNPEYADICFDIGEYYLYASEFPKSDLWYEKSLKIYNFLNDNKKIAFTHFNLGRSFCMQDRYEETLSSMSIALKYFEETKNNKILSSIFNTIGLVCKDMERYEDSIVNYEKALLIVDKSDIKLYTGILINTAMSYNANGNYKSALEFANQSIKLSKKHDNKEILNTCIYNLGTIYANLEDYDKALKHYLKAKDGIINSGNKNFIATVFGTIGTTNIRLGNLKKGREFVDESFKLAKEVNNQNIMLINYDNLAEIYSECGEYKLANECYNEYFKLKQKMMNNEILHQTKMLQSQINKLSIELETERKERRIERLSNEIEIQKRELTAKAIALVENKEMLNDVYDDLNSSKSQLKNSERLKISKLSNKIKNKMDTQAEWEEMLSWFNQVHSGFMERLKQSLPNLTLGEQKVCAFVRMKMSSKDIAALMHVSPKTVRNYRSNIRHKAGLDRKDNITRFIETI